MSNEKVCVICKEKIFEDRERWVRLTDFYCGIQGSEVYYHLECWKERFQITNSERKKKMIHDTLRTLQNITKNSGLGVAQ